MLRVSGPRDNGQILAEKIHDNRFLRLIRNMLKAGYLEDWQWNATLSGVPQGGVVSPCPLQYLPGPAGQIRRDSPDPGIHPGSHPGSKPRYARLTRAISDARRRGDRLPHGSCACSGGACPRGDPRDPGYRRLRYIRYADDHLLGFTGPKAEAEQIKQRLAEFLRDDLKLELNRTRR